MWYWQILKTKIAKIDGMFEYCFWKKFLYFKKLKTNRFVYHNFEELFFLIYLSVGKMKTCFSCLFPLTRFNQSVKNQLINKGFMIIYFFNSNKIINHSAIRHTQWNSPVPQLGDDQGQKPQRETFHRQLNFANSNSNKLYYEPNPITLDS